MYRGCVVLLFVVLACVSQARAQTSPAQDLAAIREQLEMASFRTAATAVEAYLARTDLGAAERNAGLEIDAILSLARREDARASAALAELYARDPGHRLSDPDASPVVQSAFARARETATPRTVTIESTTAARLERRAAPVVSLRLTSGADMVHELRLSYRHGGETRFATQILTPEPDGTASATLPLASDVPGAQVIELYVEALAPSSTVVGTLGSAAALETIEVPAGAETGGSGVGSGSSAPAGGGSIAEEWWFWTLIGVVVVGAGVGIGVGVATQPTSPDGTLGSVTLPLLTF